MRISTIREPNTLQTIAIVLVPFEPAGSFSPHPDISKLTLTLMVLSGSVMQGVSAICNVIICRFIVAS